VDGPSGTPEAVTMLPVLVVVLASLGTLAAVAWAVRHSVAGALAPVRARMREVHQELAQTSEELVATSDRLARVSERVVRGREERGKG